MYYQPVDLDDHSGEGTNPDVCGRPIFASGGDCWDDTDFPPPDPD
jgi:hypothetical protein